MELAPDLENYFAEKEYSAKVDTWLGMRVEQTEAKIQKIENQEIWTKVPSSAMLTPYSEMRRMLEKMNPRQGDLVVDLGAAYGRMGFVVERYFPEVNFLGLELVKERVDEGILALKKFGALRSRLEVFDLTKDSPPKAPFYFMYDFGTERAIAKTLNDLRDLRTSICVVARGRGVRDCVEKKHPWLGQVFPAEHFPHFSIYRNAACSVME